MKTTPTSSMMSSETPSDDTAAESPSVGMSQADLLRRGAWGLAALIGFAVILRINHWHIGVPQIVLCLGWLGVLASFQFLWRAGFAVADEHATDIVSAAGTAREELEREKRSLLRAIKEIEFDHEMGKHSDEDAAELTRLYRARAIEILKTLEGLDSGDGTDDIDVEVRARLVAEGALGMNRKQTKASKSSQAKHPAEGSAA